jgi:hypothetical protein
MNSLKITDGTTETVIPDSNVLQIVVEGNLITEVSYKDAADAATTEAAAPYTGANKKYEYGCYTPGNIFSAYVANYRTR